MQKPSNTYKYIAGEETYKNKDFNQLVMPTQSVEGNSICANSKFIVMPWQGGGGPFVVRNVDDFGKVTPNEPKVTGHKGQVQDLTFSPFHGNLLATSSADCTVKLWSIPDEGITANYDKFDANLDEHCKKVSLIQWHPSAEYTLAAADIGGTVKIWDVQSEKSMFDYTGNTAVPWSMQWNHDGSMLGLINKDKKMHIVDPRQQAAAQIVGAHEGTKAQRMQWKGENGMMITVGASEYNEREYAIYDHRNFGKALRRAQIDNNTQVMFSYYDEINKLFYITNKGSNFISIFYFSESGETADGLPQLVPLLPYKTKDLTTYMYFLPKHHINPVTKEIQRAVRTTNKRAEFVSFKLPRKEAGFSLDLYPGFHSKTAAMSCEQYAKGENQNPIMDMWNPRELDQQQAGRKTVVFNKKANDSALIPDKVVDNKPRGTVAVKKLDTFSPTPKETQPAKTGFEPVKEVEANSAIMDEQRETINDLEWQLQNTQMKLKDAVSECDTQTQEIKTLKDKVQQQQTQIANKPGAEVQTIIKEVQVPAQQNLVPIDKPVLGYFDIRGQAQCIRYLLSHLTCDYEDKYFKPEDMGLCLPALPYFTDKTGETISNTIPILKYIAEKYYPDLLGNSAEDKALVERVAKEAEEANTFILQLCHGGHTDQPMEMQLIAKTATLASFLDKKEGFILSDNVSYMDFYIFEMVQLMDYLTFGEIYSNYPQFKKVAQNVSQLHGLTDYLKSAKTINEMPFNLRFATYNNWPEVEYESGAFKEDA